MSKIHRTINTSFDITGYSNAFNEYVSWSVYTGYSTEGSEGNTYLGQWSGSNKDSSPAEIKKDIDARIDILMHAFKKALVNVNNENPLLETSNPSNCELLKAMSIKYFVVPEFYFHCKEGPYPDVKIEYPRKIKNKGIKVFYYTPLKYIKEKIKVRFKSLVKKHFDIYTTFHTYQLIIGSIMSCNVKDFEVFFAGDAVKERTEQFRKVYEQKNRAATVEFFYDNPNIRRFIPSTTKRDYKNYLSEILHKVQKNPLCIVRNRGLVFFATPSINSYSQYTYEKQQKSSIDLPLGVLKDGKLHHGNTITEWMANYPSYSIINGDKVDHPDTSFSRFNPYGKSLDFDSFIKKQFLERYHLQKHIYSLIKETYINQNMNLDTGIELCLDHALYRLRRTVGMTKANGAEADNYPLTAQIVPSAGMVLDATGLAVERGGAAFNSDGLGLIFHPKTYYRIKREDKLEEKHLYIENGKDEKNVIGGVYCRYMNSKWQDASGKYYYSHSQLAFAIPNTTLSGFNNAVGNKNEKSDTYNEQKKSFRKNIINPTNILLDNIRVSNIPLKTTKKIDNLLVAGIGELHHYYPQEYAHPKVEFKVGKEKGILCEHPEGNVNIRKITFHREGITKGLSVTYDNGWTAYYGDRKDKPYIEILNKITNQLKDKANIEEIKELYQNTNQQEELIIAADEKIIGVRIYTVANDTIVGLKLKIRRKNIENIWTKFYGNEHHNSISRYIHCKGKPLSKILVWENSNNYSGHNGKNEIEITRLGFSFGNSKRLIFPIRRKIGLKLDGVLQFTPKQDLGKITKIEFYKGHDYGINSVVVTYGKGRKYEYGHSIDPKPTTSSPIGSPMLQMPGMGIMPNSKPPMFGSLMPPKSGNEDIPNSKEEDINHPFDFFVDPSVSNLEQTNSNDQPFNISEDKEEQSNYQVLEIAKNEHIIGVRASSTNEAIWTMQFKIRRILENSSPEEYETKVFGEEISKENRKWFKEANIKIREGYYEGKGYPLWKMDFWKWGNNSAAPDRLVQLELQFGNPYKAKIQNV